MKRNDVGTPSIYLFSPLQPLLRRKLSLNTIKFCGRSEAGGAGFEFGVLIKYENRDAMRVGQKQKKRENERWWSPKCPPFDPVQHRCSIEIEREPSTSSVSIDGNPQVVLLSQLFYLETCFSFCKNCVRAALGGQPTNVSPLVDDRCSHSSHPTALMIATSAFKLFSNFSELTLINNLRKVTVNLIK